MSSILRALKKLEDENAARIHDPVKIDAEILRGCAPERVSSIKVILFAVFLFVCGGSATYIYMKQNQEAPHSHAKEQGSLPPKIALPSSLPMPVEVPVERIEPEAIVAAEPESNMKQNRAVSQKTAVTHVSPRPPPESPRVPPAQSIKMQHPQQLVEKRLPSITGKQKKVNVGISTSTSALQIPVLRVNGIAFQDGADSVAVVNGVTIYKGASIEGVKVDEIQRDRVLFSYGGEKFTVHLGKSNH
jgi:general secretion pathway protein B